MPSVISVVGQQGPSLHHTPEGLERFPPERDANPLHYATFRGSLKHCLQIKVP